jgi:hypothetical protein
MAKLETRRINPIAHVTLVAVIVVIVFEVLVIFGVFELKAQTVAKYAPWAYEPFLQLVGEHPESAPRWATVEEPKETKQEPLAVPLLVPTNETSAVTNAVPEPVAPTPAPAAQPKAIVPVG